jgi:BirA family biotin operon repressor/biotin-[acetyl-CoA-carboxylase] ligase
MAVEALRAFFAGRVIGRRIEYRDETGSTNTEALRLALEGTPEGTVVVADAQTEGRGRLDRTWESPPSKNLYLSVVLRPDIPAVSASLVPLMTGVAVADVVSQHCPGRVRLKWPNDVLVGGKKICGMLTEMRTRGDRVEFLIVGIGLNVNMRKLDFPPGLRDTATSLQIETDCELDRLDVAVRLFEALERWYRIFLGPAVTTAGPGRRSGWPGCGSPTWSAGGWRSCAATPCSGAPWRALTRAGPSSSRGKPACSRCLPGMSISRGCDHASGDRCGKQQHRPGAL